MSEYYEMPHERADECSHAGVGKACAPCRWRFAPLSDETVERVADVLEALDGYDYRRVARAALAAALGRGREVKIGEISKEERMRVHIAGLEATLSARNKQIERLREQIAESEESPRFKQKLKAEYKRGWKDAGNRMMNVTQRAANELRAVRESAFKLILEGDKFE